MNMHTTDLIAPPALRALTDTGLTMVMMRDILLKTMFRTNLERVSDLETTMALPGRVVQELIDTCREQALIEAMGTMQAGATSSEMGYRLSDGGKARALDALAQSEYYGAMPVPMEDYAKQVKRQSIKNIQMTREQLTSAMGHLILPPNLLDQLGPAVGRVVRS